MPDLPNRTAPTQSVHEFFNTVCLMRGWVLRVGAWCLLLLASMGTYREAAAAVIPVNFQGTNQTFGANLSASGNAFAEGQGFAMSLTGPLKNQILPFVTTAPLDHPLTISDDTAVVQASPRSVGPDNGTPYRLLYQSPPSKIGGTPTNVYVFYDPSTGDGTPGSGNQVGDPFILDANGHAPHFPPQVFQYSQTKIEANGQAIQGISDFGLDAFQGAKFDFALAQIVITTNSHVPLLQNVAVDLHGELRDLTFFQDGAATLVPTGNGVGTFAIPGWISLTADTLTATLFGVLPSKLGEVDFSLPYVLQGTYHISGSPGDPNAKIALDALGNLTLGLSTQSALIAQLGTDIVPLTVSVSFDIAASIMVDFSIHLERVGVIPEPGSIVLLALGVVSMLPVWMHRRRKQRLS